MNVKLRSIATAVPAHRLETGDVLREAAAAFAHHADDFERLRPVFANTGIACRYSVRPYAWFRERQGWPARSAAYLDGAKALFAAAAHQALAQTGLAPADIDTIVTVTSTGIATPSIEAHVLHELGFRDDVQRVPVFGLGCAGGVSGLSLAARLAAARPGSHVLLVVIELCSLAFRPDDASKSSIVATALFGDGAAAAVLSSHGAGLAEIEHCGEHSWPGTLDVMGWRIDPEGFGAIFSQSIPDLVRRDLRPALDGFLRRHGLTLGDIDSFALHPGGAKVIVALEDALGLAAGRLAHERRILRDYGNMSAPTVLFVLERALAEHSPGRRLLAALGPGFTVSLMTMLH